MRRSRLSVRARPRRLPETTSRRRACPAAACSSCCRNFSLADLESEDLLLILVLYLMYRESGDKELLFILGGMLFL